MKNGKLSQDPYQPKPPSSSSSKAVDLKLQQIGQTTSISVPQTVVQNPDSKTSTQDFSHKLDSSHVKIKDISHIVSESLLCDEQGAENNISEISIINMLGDGNLKSLNNEILNFDSIEDNEVLKRELEMKNRLIEKLMKENASLREEMESFLTSMEQAKDHLSTSVQESHHKISELEHQVAQLEGENRSLKEQLARKTEDEAGRESKMHEFERRMQHYCEYTKENMEDFYLRLNQQMLSLIDTSRRQHDNFSRSVRDHVEDLREEVLFGNKNNMSKSQSLAHSASLPSCRLERKTTTTERSFDESSFKDCMTQSLTLGTPRTGDYSAKNNYSSGKKLVSEGTKSRQNLNSYAKIDEGPELKMERRSSMATGRMNTLAGGVKKVDNNKENIPVAKKGGVKDSSAMTKSVVKGRASMGAIGNDKKKTGI